MYIKTSFQLLHARSAAVRAGSAAAAANGWSSFCHSPAFMGCYHLCIHRFHPTAYLGAQDQLFRFSVRHCFCNCHSVSHLLVIVVPHAHISLSIFFSSLVIGTRRSFLFPAVAILLYAMVFFFCMAAGLSMTCFLIRLCTGSLFL